MNFEEALPLRGEFELRIFRAGVPVEDYRDHNMIMAVARNALARLLGATARARPLRPSAWASAATAPILRIPP